MARFATIVRCIIAALALCLWTAEVSQAQVAPPLPPRGPVTPTQPDISGRGDAGPSPTIPDLFNQPGADEDQQQPGPRVDANDAIPNELIVVFPPNVAAGIPEAFAGDLELEVTRNFTAQGLGLRIYLMRLGDGAEPDQVFEDASSDQRPLWVQRNYIYRTSQSNSATDSQQYALRQMRADTPDGQAKGGSGVRVALIDSGVDTHHESLAGAEIETTNVVEEGKPVPPETHGTVLASIIVGQGPLYGVAPRAHLIAIRAFREVDPKQGGAESSSFVLSLGLETAIRAGARIINLSLTGPQDRLVAQMVTEAMMRRASVIAAAGNNGPDSPAAYPAAQDGVIAVTATDMQDRLYARANRGSYISVAAPGVDILGAKPGGTYDFFSGTSMATGYATGLAALLLSTQTDLGIVKLRQTLEKSAIDLGAPQRDPEFGAGRIDAVSAIALLP